MVACLGLYLFDPHAGRLQPVNLSQSKDLGILPHDFTEEEWYDSGPMSGIELQAPKYSQRLPERLV